MDDARDVLHYHKKNLWQNFQNLDKNSISSGLQREIDALYYRLQLEIQFDPNLLKGRVKGRYKSKTDNLRTIELDFDDHMQISAVSGPVSTYSHSGQVLHINLSDAMARGQVFEIVVEYSGIPDPGNDRWFVFDALKDGSDHVWTLSEPYGAHYWWPCKDTPLDKADSVDIIVTVPNNQLVASNGSLLSDVTEGQKRTFHWQEKYPITTYLVSLAVAPYVHFNEIYTTQENDSLLLDYYVYPQDEQLAREILPNTKKHLAILSQRFGPYPFADEKYGLAQFGWTSGAMEHQTISSIGRVRKDWEYVYIHELGHQWFGDALSCASWTDIWLNEGFASYAEALYAEKAGYNDLLPGAQSYKEYMKHQVYFGDGTLHVQDTLNLASLFGQVVYNKGSWLLHMLRRLLGEQDFFDALYAYANGDYKYSFVRTEDFKNVCEQESGKNLDKFFDQWINYPFFPRYVFSWEKDESDFGGAARIKVNILQIQTQVLYEMPIDLKFVFSSGPDTVVTVENYQQEQEYIFEFDSYPVGLVFDPDNWILKEARDQSGGEFLSQIVVENVYPNPAKSTVNIDVIFWGQNALSLKVYDINGREINHLKPYLSSRMHRYYFKWQCDDRFGHPVACGVYFIKPVNRDYSVKAVRKVVILK